MHITYDPELDALYIELRDVERHGAREISPGINVDFDKDGNVIGIEVLDAKRRVDSEPTQVLIEVLASEPAAAR